MRTREEVQSFLMKRKNEMEANPTPSEARLKSALEALGIRHVFQSIKFSKGVYRIFDFYIPKKRIAIEVDGGYHDSDYDSRRDRQVIKNRRRITILRFSNRQVDEELDQVLAQIQSEISSK